MQTWKYQEKFSENVVVCYYAAVYHIALMSHERNGVSNCRQLDCLFKATQPWMLNITDAVFAVSTGDQWILFTTDQ